MDCLKPLLLAACCVSIAGKRVHAQLEIPVWVRIGPFGELTTRPLLDPSAGARTVISFASVGEFRLDIGVRRHMSPTAGGAFVGTLGGTFQFNALGGYPERQLGVFGGYQYFAGAERGGELMLGASVATSHGRGEHFQYEPTVVLRFKNHRTLPLFRFKLVAIRLPPFPFQHRVPKPPPLQVRIDSVDAGGVPQNPRWTGAIGKNPDQLCRFSYSQMSGTPLLIYLPECVGGDPLTLNQPVSPETAKHGGLSCSVKDAEPIIRGHINWFVVSQTGRLRWGGFSGGIGDHDFDLFMVAPGLVTRGNLSANRNDDRLRTDASRDSLIEIEFNGVETAGLFSTDQGGALWNPLIALRRLSNTSDGYREQDRRADSLFRNRTAVVTGLLGLDGEHDFHTELHPVFAFAADVSHFLPDRYAQAWLVFIRNMGNEGECSDNVQLPWGDSTRYVLEIPWKTGADSVSVEVGDSRFGFIARRPASVRAAVDPGRAVRLVADLPRPAVTDSTAIVYGTLRLRWFEQGLPLPHDSAVPAPAEVSQYVPPREQERGFAPANERGFPTSRRLCVRLMPLDSVRRDLPASFLPQKVLRDTGSPAPAVVDTAACGP
jgi:hypothetical protein